MVDPNVLFETMITRQAGDAVYSAKGVIPGLVYMKPIYEEKGYAVVGDFVRGYKRTKSGSQHTCNNHKGIFTVVG